MRPHHLRAAAGSSGGIVTTNMYYYDFGNGNSYTPGNNYLYALKPDGTNWDNLGSSSPLSFSINGSNSSTWSSTKGGILNLDYYPVGSSYYAAHLYQVGPNTSFPQSFGAGPFTLEFYHGNIYAPNPSYASHTLQILKHDLFQIVWNPLTFLQQYAELEIDQTYYNITSRNFTGSSNTSSTYVPLESSYAYSGGFPTAWEQLVFVREHTGTNGMKFYRNGTLVGTHTNSVDYDTWGAQATQYQTTLYRMKASLGLFRVYTGTALTQSEILTHYNIEKPRFGLP